MNCRDAIAVIAKFLEQSRAYLETYRMTIALTGRAEHVERPAEMKTRLRSLLLEELRRGRASS